MGDNDLPVLRFYNDYPEYRHYWIIEYDVRYTGNWKELFDDLNLSNADLLGTNILDYGHAPGWPWWSVEQLPPSFVALAARVKAFLPFFRVSNSALRAIDALYREGWSGHYEMTFPTICKVNGLAVEDIGGNGLYTPADRKHKHYLSNSGSFSLFPGTFVFKPSFGDADVRTYGEKIMRQPMLWHPIK